MTADGRLGVGVGMEPGPAIEFLPPRSLVVGPVTAFFPLAPGDRALVAAGEAVVAGAPLAEIIRDGRTVALDPSVDGDLTPGSHWSGGGRPRRDRGGPAPNGEILFRSAGRWRLATGEHRDRLEAPFAGIVVEARAGVGIALRSPARAIPGEAVVGGPSRGRLEVATAADGELRASAIDVGRSGTILVVGSRIDAEALTRARAMGVRGIVVASLPSKERRDLLASDRRQRAALQRPPPFAVLVLDGSVRRPIARSTMAILEALRGRDVAIVDDPPGLVFDEPSLAVPAPVPGTVLVRAGPLAAAEGRWVGLGGLRRFGGATWLESGLVQFDEGDPVAIPIGDIERYA